MGVDRGGRGGTLFERWLGARKIFTARGPGPVSPARDGDRSGAPAGRQKDRRRETPELTEQALLQQVAPVGALVNG